MKPQEKKPEIVFRVIDRETGFPVSSRACWDQFDFDSVERARTASTYGTFTDRARYAGAKYRVIYELLDPDVDGGGSDPPFERARKDESFFDYLWRSWRQNEADAPTGATPT